MAYIVNVTETATATSGATYAVTLGTHTTNDLLMACLSQDTGTTTISLGSDALTSVTVATDVFVYSGSDVFNDGIQVEFSGTLGTSLQANTRYWVRDLNTGAKSFKVSATDGGGVFDVTGSPSGVTCHRMTGGAAANNNCVGWAIIGTQAASQAVRQVWAYKFATGAGTATPTFTGTNDDWLGTCLVIRDALTSWTPKWQRSDWGNSTNIAEASSNTIAASSAGGTTLITSATDSLDIYSWVTDGGNVYLRTTADGMIGVSKQLAACGHIIGYRQHGASGNPTAVTAYCNTFNEGGNGWVISVDNKVNGNSEKDCRAGVNEFAWYGDFWSINKQTTVTLDAATDFITYTNPTTDMWSNGQPVFFTTTGTLISGAELVVNTVYYIVNADTANNKFQVSATVGGAAIAFSGTSSGVQSAFHTLANPAILSASVGGITCSTTNPTIANNVRPALSPWGAFSGLSSTQSTAGHWVGGVDVFPATDMTNKIFGVQWQTDFGATSAFAGTSGAIVVFSDGTNYSAYQLSASANYVNGNLEQNFISLGNGTTFATSGSINWAAVTQIGYFYHRIGSTASSGTLAIRNAFLMGTSTITGGGADRPSDFVILNDALNFWGGYDLVRKQGATQILGKGNVQIGDGTLFTYFDSSAGAFAYPLEYLGTDIEKKKWNVPASQVTLSVYAKSGDTINLAAGATTTDTLQALTINASSDTGATYSFAGNSFVGWTPTWKTGIACANATFKKCATVAFKGAAPNTVSISNSDSTVDSTNGATCSFDTNSSMTSCTTNVTKEDGTVAGYHIELGTGVTAFTLANHTFTGSATTNKVHVLKTTGTVTITISGTTSLSSGEVTSAGATVVIAAPTINQSVTISGATAGSRIQIYDTTSSTELYNGTPTFPYTWTDPAVASADRAIRLRVAYVSGVTAKSFIEANIGTCGQTSGTESINYLVNQTNDTVYNTNAINGSAVTGITIVEGSTDRVQISIAGGSVTWGQIYAYQCYWLFDVVGITDDGAFISAPDTANYILTGFKIKNTHASVPLSISGGYGVDSTGSVSVLYDTTGTSIFPSPAHVVPYSSGSGAVTAQNITDIAAAVAATTPAAVWLESKALTISKFLGLK